MTAVYLYDASDRCIMSQVNGYATYFVPEGDRVLQEVDGNSAQVTKEYVWGSAIDELVILQLDGEIYHAHADALGSTSLLTDANGDIVERYDYNPFGACVATDVNGGGLVGNPYWFTGRRLNSETGLYYYSARHYTTEMGRFLSPDPIGPRGDETNWGNAYAYGGNNPFSGWDPTGMGWFRDTFNSVRDFGAGLVGGAVESVTFGFVESSTVGNALGADTASVSYKAGSLTGAIGTGIALNVATSGIFGAADATVSLTRGAIQVGVGIANGSTESVFSGLASIGLELLPGALPSGTSPAGRGLANVGDDAGSISRNSSGVGTNIEPSTAGNVLKSGQFRDANGRLRNSDGTFAYDGGPNTKPTNSTHGNTAGDQPATLYERYDADGNFLKHGVSQDPSKRYTQSELNGGYLIETQTGPRKDILKIERDLVETDPGPLNSEPWAGSRRGQ